MRSSTETLVAAMRVLARDIESGDGVANAAISEAAERLEELHADHVPGVGKMVTDRQMAIDCTKCVNRGRAIPGADESYCSHCVYGTPWRRDYYDEGPVGGVAHSNCDGCACGWPVRGGLHVSPSGRTALGCTANRYKAADK
jgi:ribosomal protein L37E